MINQAKRLTYKGTQQSREEFSMLFGMTTESLTVLVRKYKTNRSLGPRELPYDKRMYCNLRDHRIIKCNDTTGVRKFSPMKNGNMYTNCIVIVSQIIMEKE